ncbi:MAG: hypothetical protein Q9190_006322 [Brigantiaea leucoxantha]
MRPCDNCKRLGKRCLVGEGSDKCARCVSVGCACDLAPNPAAWERLEKERQRVFNESNEALAKFNRLQKQLVVLEERKRKIVDLELKNIEELEREEEEQRVAAEAAPMFDVASETLTVPDLDWSSLFAESS